MLTGKISRHAVTGNNQYKGIVVTKVGNVGMKV